MDFNQLKNEIIIPVLQKLNMYSPEAVELMLGTVSQESRGKYIAQLGNGIARGLWQIEPLVAQDCYENFLNYRPDLKKEVDELKNPKMSLTENLTGNLFFQCAIARVIYYRKPTAIPKDLQGQAEYWKKYYNTELGKGTVEEYIKNYNKLVKGI